MTGAEEARRAVRAQRMREYRASLVEREAKQFQFTDAQLAVAVRVAEKLEKKASAA